MPTAAFSDPAFISSVSFSRQANTTAYDALDVVGPATSAILTLSDCGPINGLVYLTDSIVRLNTGTLPTGIGNLRLHLYREQPAAVEDAAAFSLVSGDRAKSVGYIDLGTPTDDGDTCQAVATGHNKLVRVGSSGQLYGVLQTIAGWTPESGTGVYVEIGGVVA